jgi:RNA-directed DNA polymerase
MPERDADKMAGKPERSRKVGAPGVDGITVDALKPLLQARWKAIREELLGGTYRPSPVRKVEIPKPGGKGVRMLGIPTVLDRLIQQAVHQVLQRYFDPRFSDASFGFRPRRSAHQAIERAREHIAAGHRWVVDMDLEKFFDRVNHDILMSRLARHVEDKRILRLIRRYLQAGMMEDGLVTQRTEGTPQGGPLSPLLSNILLDELDGEVDRPWNRKFLGYTVTPHRQPKLKVSHQSVSRLKDKLREMFRRGRGRSLRRVLEDLRPVPEN